MNIFLNILGIFTDNRGNPDTNFSCLKELREIGNKMIKF